MADSDLRDFLIKDRAYTLTKLKEKEAILKTATQTRKHLRERACMALFDKNNKQATAIRMKAEQADIAYRAASDAVIYWRTAHQSTEATLARLDAEKVK